MAANAAVLASEAARIDLATRNLRSVKRLGRLLVAQTVVGVVELFHTADAGYKLIKGTIEGPVVLAAGTAATVKPALATIFVVV